MSSVSVLYILFCFLCLWVFPSALFQFCRFYSAFLFSAYWHLLYFNSGNFTLLYSSLHINICSILFLYIWLCFPCLCILISAVFLDLVLVASSLHIHICSILTLCILVCFRCLCIMTSEVFHFDIFDFILTVSAY